MAFDPAADCVELVGELRGPVAGKAAEALKSPTRD
jgi:hypothetical protein